MTDTTSNLQNEFYQAEMERIRAATASHNATIEAQHEHAETMRVSRRLQAKQVEALTTAAIANCIQAIAAVGGALALAYGAGVFR
jgi:hypothetical protein